MIEVWKSDRVIPDVIKRTPAQSNKSMYEYCEMLYRIVSKTKEVKVGRGRNVEIVHIKKYNTPDDVVARIHRSCDYYKKLYETQAMRTIELRDYQKEITEKAVRILYEHRFVYLTMQMRVGKTLTSLNIAEEVHSEYVLFVTKKKAISSIISDYNKMRPSYYMCVTNYENLHNVIDDYNWDLVIVDEAHSLGAFPKPSGRAKMIKDVIEKCNPRVILMSGTPTPESFSQMYHQVYGIQNNPFRKHKTFYKFCDEFVRVTTKKINGHIINDYSKGLPTILDAMKPFSISYTQQEAGFTTEIEEEILEVDMKESTYNLIKRLKRDLVILGKEETILADTPVKLMSKIHQLCSGTIKFESGNSTVLDTSKAEFIKEHFDGCKIGIFYKFKEELNALKKVFGDSLTTELEEFDSTTKNIALQIVSGREGVSLRNAEYLVYYNIDFSATSYWQSRDRMTTMERTNNTVFWIFSKGGIEYDVYKTVIKKKDFTVKHFKKLIQ
ncbi:MAG: type I site specific restriction modification system [Podoviridae sp. ctrTa16]|nr:MAG: type I site specific restriction modification system [Podoviridae sp. ctrTa16]